MIQQVMKRITGMGTVPSLHNISTYAARWGRAYAHDDNDVNDNDDIGTTIPSR